MTEPEDRLSRLLHQAVDDLEPRHALPDVRAAVRAGAPAPGADRTVARWRGFAAAGLAAAVVAAVVVGIFAVARPSTGPTPPPVGDAPPSVVPPVETAAASQDARDVTVVPVYFTGPDEPTRLRREFQQVPRTENPLLVALTLATEGSAEDPDYGTPWPVDDDRALILSAEYDGTTIDVDLNPLRVDELATAPAGTGPEEAALMLQQVVYTAQGVVSDRAPVRLTVEDRPLAQLLGVDTSQPLVAAPESETLAAVNVSDPREGLRVDLGTLVVDGRANPPDGTVSFRVLRDGVVVEEGRAEVAGDQDVLREFGIRIDLSDLDPGDYTLEVSAPSAGTAVDDRLFTVEVP